MVVQLAPEHYEICGLVHISNFTSTECGKVQSNPNLPYGNLVHQIITYSLVTIDRFKFIDNNAILITFFHFGDMIGT